MVMSIGTQQPETRTISAAEFKAKCLQLMDEVNTSNLTLVVTKRGRPVVQLTAPIEAPSKPFRSIFGRTPDIKVPTHDEWVKLKERWAGEWENSADEPERSARKAKRKKSAKQ
jgi:prevent-host-death family protein